MKRVTQSDLRAFNTRALKIGGLCALSILTASGLVACGGSSTPAVAPAAPTTITGTAATGAAFAGATVSAADSQGAVGTSAQPVAADGTYSVTISSDAKAPIVLTATRTTTTGQQETLVSFVPDIAKPTANITPITNVIAAMLSPTGEPDKLASQFKATPAIVSASGIQAKLATVQSSLDSVLAAANVKTFNPLTDSFKADGLGYDRLLDSLNISIIPTGVASNIEIAVRSAAANGNDQPPVVQFVSSASSVPAIAAASVGTIVSTGVGAKIATFVADANICYSLPLTQRVSTATSDTVPAIGTAADISAAACKTLFTTNDPAKYKNNGGLIGRNASGAGQFTGIYSDAAANVRFSGGKFEFTLPNNDMVISYLTKAPTVTTFTTSYLTVRQDSDGKLRAVGNQYAYNGFVRPFMQSRQFLTLNQSVYNYLTTAYNFNVDNTGQFSKVEVVSPPLPGKPSGVVTTLVPDAAVSFLRISGKGSTNLIRLRSAFSDASLASAAVPTKLPSEDSSLAFLSPELSDAEIASLPAQSAWTFKYYLTGNTGTTPDATQVFRTYARAMTIPELKTVGFAKAGPTLLATIAANTNADGNVPLETTAGVSFDWTVPAGAAAPTGSTLFGRYNTTGTTFVSFTDSVSYASTARSSIINCSTQGATDTHCASATNGGFKPGSTSNGLNLTVTDGLERTFATQLNAYRLTVAP